MNELKDSVANVATLGGLGATIMSWNELLTGVLIITGIFLNVQRIIHNNKKNQDSK